MVGLKFTVQRLGFGLYVVQGSGFKGAGRRNPRLLNPETQTTNPKPQVAEFAKLQKNPQTGVSNRRNFSATCLNPKPHPQALNPKPHAQVVEFAEQRA